MKPLDPLITSEPERKLRHVSRMAMGILTVFFIWASFAKLEEVAVATGEVVPQEQIQSIQHLEGGIIEKIDVFEGDVVKQGQSLMQLNLSAFTANKEEVQITLESQTLKKIRLEAEAQDKPFILGDAQKKFHANLVNAEMQVYAARKQELESRVQVLREQTSQRELDVKQLETEQTSLTRNLKLLHEKLSISNDLLKDKLTSQMAHLQLKGEVQELDGKLKSVDVSIPRAKAALAEAQEKLRNELLVFHNNALDELTKLEADLARTQEMMNKASDQVTRTTITSPINGVVKSLKTHTIGGVVKPGDVIMEIVPSSKNLLMEVRLNPRDIGFVKVGQAALVKFLTYDYGRYGGLQGKVISISADSHTDPQSHDSYFLVKIRTEKSYLGSSSESFPVTAGMQATAEIKTGSKTVMEYLLKPIIKISSESFHER